MQSSAHDIQETPETSFNPHIWVTLRLHRQEVQAKAEMGTAGVLKAFPNMHTEYMMVHDMYRVHMIKYCKNIYLIENLVRKNK